MNTSISLLLFYIAINIHITFHLLAACLPFTGLVSPWLFPVVIEFASEDMTGLALPFHSHSVAPLFPCYLHWLHKLQFAYTQLVYVIEKNVSVLAYGKIGIHRQI